MKPEIRTKKSFGLLIDIQHILRSIGQFLVHLSQMRKLLQIIGSQIHITLNLPLIDTLTQDRPSIPMQVLIKFDSNKSIAADKLADIRDLDIEISACQELFGYVLDDPIQAEFGCVF